MPDPRASSSRKKAKWPPPMKIYNRPYINVNMVRALYRDNTSCHTKGGSGAARYAIGGLQIVVGSAHV
jgi:hypothetical protein